MNVLLISHSNEIGGVSVAVDRLYRGLDRVGIGVNCLLGNTSSTSDRIQRVSLPSRYERYLEAITRRIGLNYVHLASSFQLRQHPYVREAEIVHFHNIHSGYLNYLAIPHILRRKAGVLTLHDFWAFTGHCAYPKECDRWQMGCGRCPYLDSYPAVQRDATAWEWKLKQWVYRNTNLEIVSPSRWLLDRARQSLLGRFPLHHIPHGIDTEVFQPLDRQACRTALRIPSHAKVILFAAAFLWDGRKGFDFLRAALDRLPADLRRNLFLLLMGRDRDRIDVPVDIPSLHLGYVTEDCLKAIAYSAADVFAFPTREDIFGLVALEAIACGTPVVSFDVCAVPEIVRPNVTGFLAPANDVDEFARGLETILSDDRYAKRLGQTCRKVAVEEYGIDLHVRRHIELYRHLLEKTSQPSKG